MREISTAAAPPSIGPFSQAVRDGDRVYVSGQGPIDPDSGEVVGETAAEQTERTLDNVAAILAAADCSLDDVVKATVYLTDMGDYDAVNDVYGDRMSEPYPAREAVEVSDLPVDIAVEISIVASAN